MSNLSTLVKTTANRITLRHYRSQPLPQSYSKPFGYAVGNPQPSIMQQAFINAVLKGSK